jgi:hypothetical protein
MKTFKIVTRKITVLLIVLTLGFAFSCKESSEKKKDSTKTTTSTPVISKENTTESKGDIALNPAHGQPGHRCDISVGAPLDSAPTTPVTSNQGSPLINASAQNLNPAHGQPGHRCDIAVGAPLDSAPANTSSSAPSSSPLINSGDLKLNPAHGQAGHRCDIKVGDPL